MYNIAWQECFSLQRVFIRLHLGFQDFILDRVQTPAVSAVSVTASVMEALERVLRLASVASKRYLTNKVDRSVTGLIAQQQCVGPVHTPLADVAVTALSHFHTVSSAVQ